MKIKKINVSKKINVKTKGMNNGRWSGGTNSHYKDHYKLKLNRKERLKQVNNKCEKCNISNCKLSAVKKDGNRNNHNINNLIMLCSKCMGKKQNSKFRLIYGMTLTELSKKYNVPMSKIYSEFIPKHTTKIDMINALKDYKNGTFI